MPVESGSSVIPEVLVSKKAIMRRALGHIAIGAAVIFLGLVQSPTPSQAADHEVNRPLLELQPVSFGQHAPFEALQPSSFGEEFPHLLPYRDHRQQGVGVAMQIAPIVAGSNIRWHTSTTTAGQTAIANTKSHVWVKIDQKPSNRGIFLAFVIGLFTISASGVMLMWRQIGKPSEVERPGWEKWRH